MITRPGNWWWTNAVRRSSINPETPHDVITEPLTLPAGKPTSWHIFTDGSVIEVFINDELALAASMYPTETLSLRIYSVIQVNVFRKTAHQVNQNSFNSTRVNQRTRLS